eukprot:7761538-Heterocapsa_arctica.AAC.1
MFQTREHNNNQQIGYIMFEDLGNKDYASRPQAETHAYCMENKNPDNYPKQTRITKSEIHNRGNRAMTYGQLSSAGKGGNKHLNLNQRKHGHQANTTYGKQRETVESIMAMGFICG